MQVWEFLERGITPWHVQNILAAELDAAGFIELAERKSWQLERGGAYYVKRGAAIVAFRVGREARFALSACHTDSPGFRLKQAPDGASAGLCVARTEPYGGGIWHTWTDRPLGVAGVVMIEMETGIRSRLVDLQDHFVIPSVAIHYNREINKHCALDPSVDLDLVSARPITELIAEAAGAERERVLAAELCVYARQKHFAVGDLVCAPRADNLTSAAAMLDALVAATAPAAISVAFFATHEEVGSLAYGGAGDTTLADALARIAECLGRDVREMLADSMLLSVDNAHAAHPLHPELGRGTDTPVLGGGVTLKFNANRRYTTDAESAAAVLALARKAGVPAQTFSMRSDLPCGSTLGVVGMGQVSVRSADIGIAQLAMHAYAETFSPDDCAALTRLLTAFDAAPPTFDGGVRLA